MVKIPNPISLLTKPLAFVTKPITNLRDKIVGDAISGGTKRAVSNIRNDILGSLKNGVGNIGKFAGNHKKELALAATAVAALAASKNMLWPSNTPAPPPPTMVENILSLVKENGQKVAPYAPIAGLLGVAAPLLMNFMSGSGGGGEEASEQPNTQEALMSMMQGGVKNVQSGAPSGQGNPFLEDFNVDLSDMAGNGHSQVSGDSKQAMKIRATDYLNRRIAEIQGRG